MNPISIATLARLFRIAGLLVGLPSLAWLVLCAGLLLQLPGEAPPPAPAFGTSPDGVLVLLQGLAQGIGAVAQAVGAIARIVLDLAAVAAGIGLLAGLASWFTGRGLQRRARWAPAGAAALLGLQLLAALLLALAGGGGFRLAMLALAALGVLGLHALWADARPGAA